MAAPPMPRRPASNPVRIPATMIAAARKISSPAGTPYNITIPGKQRRNSGGGGLSQFEVCVQHHRQGFPQHVRARAGGNGFGCEMPAERARTRLAAEETEKMSRDVVQAGTFHHCPLDIGK